MLIRGRYPAKDTGHGGALGVCTRWSCGEHRACPNCSVTGDRRGFHEQSERFESKSSAEKLALP